jgi:DNA-binding HxlR family transcriptional regulator
MERGGDMATTTAAARRQDAKQQYDAYLAACPSRQVFDMVGNKWVGLIVTALHEGPMRHGELRTRIAGISQKMLTQSLRALEADGLLTRTVTAAVPPRVDYELTPLGQDLFAVIEPLKRWAEQHMTHILENRSAAGGAQAPCVPLTTG